MRLFELEQPAVGDILEIELGDAIVEAVIIAIEGDEIIAETDNRQGASILAESYGKYYCSTDKKWKERQGPKQTREAANPAQQAAIAKKKKAGIAEGTDIDARIANLKDAIRFETPRSVPGEDHREQYVRHAEKIASYKAELKKLVAQKKQQGVAEEKQRLDPKCWDGYKKQGTKMKGGVRVNNCVKEEEITEAEYQGRKVALGKPMQGDVKKFKVYVKDPGTGNVKKVNFGDPNMRIKKSNPKRRKSFRARHNCANPGPRTKARYWSCRKW